MVSNGSHLTTCFTFKHENRGRRRKENTHTFLFIKSISCWNPEFLYVLQTLHYICEQKNGYAIRFYTFLHYKMCFTVMQYILSIIVCFTAQHLPYFWLIKRQKEIQFTKKASAFVYIVWHISRNEFICLRNVRREFILLYTLDTHWLIQPVINSRRGIASV